ncbi:maleylpyruvate isomerase family mycothiol-dependent enzyme [Nonomuraea sp. NPDC050790]|uniref:maleylpyruvate isomerase family mycothiol-dependent enzyme n=1 Tax=Nonomuraea sp. NPDC050790 TaxID=3364371 RepID=UPI0037AC47CA
MDYVGHFRREVRAFEAAGRRVAGREAPPVPSCAGWTMSDLVMHLAGVHRVVTAVIEERLAQAPDPSGLAHLLPSDTEGWPLSGRAPSLGVLPVGLVDWFAEGAAVLEEVFVRTPPDTRVWTWSAEQTAGFWARMQMIEAAVHRWDAENALGEPGDMDAELAADAVAQTFEVMVPGRRALKGAPAGAGETFRFVCDEGSWTVRFEGDRLVRGGSPDMGLSGPDGEVSGPGVEVSGTASQLMLFLWQRIPAERLAVSGDRGLLDRYFELVPPM